MAQFISGSLFLSTFVVWQFIVRFPITRYVKDAQLLHLDALKQQFPNKYWLIIVFEILSLVLFFIFILFGVGSAIVLFPEPHEYYLGFCFTFSGLNLFVGLFEIATGMIPTKGIMLKRVGRQRYIVSPKDARIIGVIHIILTLGSVGMYLGIYMLLSRIGM